MGNEKEFSSQENEAFFKDLVENAAIAIIVDNPDGSFRYYNRHFREMFGYADSKLKKLSIQELVHPDDKKRVLQYHLDRIAGKDAPSRYEFRGIRKDKSVRHFVVDAVALSENGQISGTRSYLADVTEKKEAENKLAENKERYKSLFRLVRLMADNVPDMIWAKDKEKKYLFANEAICRDLLNAEDTTEPIGKTDLFFAERERKSHPKNKKYHTFGEICCDSDSEVLKSKKAQRFEEYGNVKGKFLFLDVYKAPFWDEEGKLIGTVGCGRDVTHERAIADELKEKEEKLQLIYNSVFDMITHVDVRGRILDINDRVTEILGYTRDDLVGKHFGEAIALDRKTLSMVSAIFMKAVTKNPTSGVIEIPLSTRDGETRHFEVATTFIKENGKVKSVVNVFRDITMRKKTEHELSKLSTSVNQSPAITVITDTDGNIEYINPTCERITGYEAKEVVGKNPSIFSSGENEKAFYATLWKTLKKGKTWRGEFHNRKKNGDYYWEQASISPLKDVKGKVSHFIKVADDVTSDKAQLQAIQKALEEKEVLLKEIHHRVKNNLQIIMSLLSLQSNQIRDENALQAFDESRRRIHSMALVHEQLYQSENLSEVNFSDYVKLMTGEIIKSTQQRKSVKIELDIEPSSLTIDTAIPCGLIINELVTNAIKHAFPDKKTGTIGVAFSISKSFYQLQVRDNGLGIPGDIDFSTTKSLGLRLVYILTDQIKGKLTLKRDSGTSITIVFPR